MVQSPVRAYHVLTSVERRSLSSLLDRPEVDVDVARPVARAIRADSPVTVCGCLLQAAQRSPRDGNGLYLDVLAERAATRYAATVPPGRATQIGVPAQAV